MGHSLNEEKKSRKVERASGTLKAPSLIRKNNTYMDKHTPDNKTAMIQTGRPKCSTNMPTKPSKENTGVKNTDMNKFARGPGQWSVSGKTSDKKNDANRDEVYQTNQKQNSTPAFQRCWSFQKPSLPSNRTSVDITMSFQAPTISNLSRSFSGPLQLPEYFRKVENDKKEMHIPQMKTNSYQDNLTSQTITPSLASTSSIPSKVSKEFEQMSKETTPCIGILKTPGKRRISSNNRVEFLDNLREREIPGRHT